jgi:hypothetical protein
MRKNLQNSTSILGKVEFLFFIAMIQVHNLIISVIWDFGIYLSISAEENRYSSGASRRVVHRSIMLYYFSTAALSVCLMMMMMI